MYRNQQIKRAVKIILRTSKMKVRYIGPNQGSDTFTNNKVYPVLGVKTPWIKIIDDSDEDYVYLINEPRLLDSKVYGKFEIIKDDENGTLKKAFDEVKKWVEGK